MKLKHSQALLMRSIAFILAVFALVALFIMQAQLAFAAGSPAFVRVVHASPDIGTADVFLDGAKVLSNFAFGTITDYVTIPPGPHKVQVALIGKGPNASVITQTLAVQPGVAYTVAGIGMQTTGFSLEVFIDNDQLAAGQAKVRVYHLSPGTGSVNVSKGSSTLISGLNYQQASAYLTVPAGAYTFDVTATQAGATLPLAETLKANTVTSVFAIGVVNGNPKLQFKSAQVAGIPGMPPTGSDPNPTVITNPTAIPVHGQALTAWLFGALALLVLGACVATRRFALARHKARG